MNLNMRNDLCLCLRATRRRIDRVGNDDRVRMSFVEKGLKYERKKLLGSIFVNFVKHMKVGLKLNKSVKFMIYYQKCPLYPYIKGYS